MGTLGLHHPGGKRGCTGGGEQVGDGGGAGVGGVRGALSLYMMDNILL